jgi:hypothetical protein
MEDMKRLTNSSVSFRSSDPSSKPSFASITIEEMQRLANTNICFPSQEQPPNPAPGNVTMEMMQRKRASKEDMQRLASMTASFRAQDLKESQPFNLRAEVDAEEVAERLRKKMEKSSATQKALQDWDEERGLPRSHSQTMVSSSRSRKQLQQGKIIKKWDGSPLILTGSELGEPKKSRASSEMSLPKSPDILLSLVTLLEASLCVSIPARYTSMQCQHGATVRTYTTKMNARRTFFPHKSGKPRHHHHHHI